MLVRNTLDQDTQEWLEWREFGIGQSDSLVVMGKSEYKTKWELWAEKVGIRKPADLSKNPHVRRGKYLEPLVRKLVEQKMGEPLDVFCGHDSDHEWRRVSFDGVFSSTQAPVEIKCPYGLFSEEDLSLLTEEQMEHAANDKYLDLIENNENSKLFRTYEYQLQGQIGMLDAEFGYLVFYFEHCNDLRIYKVMRNDNMINEAFSAIDDFWLNHVQTGIPPEKDPLRDVYTPTEDEYLQWDTETLALFDVVKRKRDLKKELADLSKEEDELIFKLHEMASDFKMIALHGLKINIVAGRKTFSYKDFLKDKNIEISDADIEKFTKVGKVSTRISPFKDALMDDIKSDVVDKQRKKSLSLFADMFSESESDDEVNDDILFI